MLRKNRGQIRRAILRGSIKLPTQQEFVKTQFRYNFVKTLACLAVYLMFLVLVASEFMFACASLEVQLNYPLSKPEHQNAASLESLEQFEQQIQLSGRGVLNEIAGN